jgi:hypothetical protein
MKFIMKSALFCVGITVLLFAGGCKKEDDIFDNSAAKIYTFWERPAFDGNGRQTYLLSNYNSTHYDGRFVLKIRQTSTDDSRKVMAPLPVKIGDEEQYFNQCGTWDIEINVKGEVIKIPEFRYNGEENIMVARGNGWSLYISREDWMEL